MNTERLHTLADYIEKMETPIDINGVAYGFDITSYIRKKSRTSNRISDYASTACNTTACIAGWDQLMFRMEQGIDLVKAYEDDFAQWTRYAMSESGERLGLTPSQAVYLFLTGVDYHPTPKEAATALRELADNGSFNWRLVATEYMDTQADRAERETAQNDNALDYVAAFSPSSDYDAE